MRNGCKAREEEGIWKTAIGRVQRIRMQHGKRMERK
jgi:hypothetical protein